MFISYLIIFFIIVSAGALGFHFYKVGTLTRKVDRLESSFEHLKSLCRSIEMFSHHNDPREIAALFAAYGRTLSGAQKVIIWLERVPGCTAFSGRCLAVRGPREVLPESRWLPCLQRYLQERKSCGGVFCQFVRDNPPGELISVSIKNSSTVFGVFSAFFTEKSMCLSDARQLLTFLADICAAALEKYNLENIAAEESLSRERARIAGEIHDGVTQNLFSLIYGMEALLKNDGLDEYTARQLRLLQKNARTSFRDLRSCIYGLPLHNEERRFPRFIEEYLFELGELNNIVIVFDCRGSFDRRDFSEHHTIYRLIREATGNAVRHARCTRIEVTMEAIADKIKVCVADNGCGFDFEGFRARGGRGLGLDNMRELVRSRGGAFLLESSPGKGTMVSCEIPTFVRPVSLTAEEELVGENSSY